MDHAAQRMRVGWLLGAAALVASAALPHSAARAGTLTSGVDLLTAGLACGSAGTPVATAKLLGRVRAEATAPVSGRAAAAKARAAPEPRRSQQITRPAKPQPSRQARKYPQAEQEPRGAVVHSLYTCNATPVPDLTEGTGWRLVGPLRNG
jgi:hypothetical protein